MPKLQIEMPEEMKHITLTLDKPIPTEIEITGIPESIKLDTTDLPKSIKLDTTSLPDVIHLIPHDIPSTIRIDGSEIPRTIKIEGMPQVIELKAPEAIPLKLPENFEIPLVYKGGPVPIQFDVKNFQGADSESPRFFIVPAPCPQA